MFDITILGMTIHFTLQMTIIAVGAVVVVPMAWTALKAL
jgi:hypothetical protein